MDRDRRQLNPVRDVPNGEDVRHVRAGIVVDDDGPGIPEGRLAEAEAQGRMGVSRSIRGRVGDVGGTLTLDTGPDIGTEWVIRVPREDT